jgi:hypothetical protein
VRRRAPRPRGERACWTSAERRRAASFFQGNSRRCGNALSHPRLVRQSGQHTPRCAKVREADQTDGDGQIVRKGGRKKDRGVSAATTLNPPSFHRRAATPDSSAASALMDPSSADVNGNTRQKLIKVSQRDDEPTNTARVHRGTCEEALLRRAREARPVSVQCRHDRASIEAWLQCECYDRRRRGARTARSKRRLHSGSVRLD